MKKIFKVIGVVSVILVGLALFLVLYLAVYPELSDVRKRCNQIEIDMTKEQAVAILGDLITDRSNMIVDEKEVLYVTKNGVDCQVKLNDLGLVTNVTSAVDGF